VRIPAEPELAEFATRGVPSSTSLDSVKVYLIKQAHLQEKEKKGLLPKGKGRADG
jgi:hypothetical protein